jgi:hypothetical protein
MNDPSAHERRSEKTSGRRPPERTSGSGLTALQECLVRAYGLLEDAREELTAEQWRALIWILCDRVGEEAARLVLAEALDATEEAA